MFKELQKQIDTFVEQNSPSEEKVDRLYDVAQQIERDIKTANEFSKAQIVVFGSLLNGTFESDASDLDMSIFVDEDNFRDHLQIL